MVNSQPTAIPAAFARKAQLEREEHVESVLYQHERDWRFIPGDGQDPRVVSEAALRREWAVEQELQAWLSEWPAADRPAADSADVLATRHRLKYFPVLFISAPHIEDGATGSFPGLPTPLLHATAVLDRMLRIDEFPGPRVPDVVATMNPPSYNPDFEADVIRCLTERRPVVVGISNLSEGHFYALRIARLVKAVLPQALVILGGQHEDAVNPQIYHRASDRVRAMVGRRANGLGLFGLTTEEEDRLAALQTLAADTDRACVDLVIAGDGQYALLEVLKIVSECQPAGATALKARLLASRDRFAALQGTGDLHLFDPETGRVEGFPFSGLPIDGDTLPFIDVTRLSHENRFSVFGNRNTAQILACLGCKYACEFCHESADAFLYGQPKIRQRSPEHVVKEIELRQEQGFEAVFFDDSTFTQNPRWLTGFLDLLEKRDPDTGIEWGCQTTINDIDETMLHRMAANGCSYIYFGLESAAPQETSVQKVQQLRVLTGATDWADRLRQVAHWCREAGVRIGTSLQFGLGETWEERVQTMDLVAELHKDGCIPEGCVSLNINSPYPGTRQWLRMLKSGGPMPDYRSRLIRHQAFETAHQYSKITGKEVADLYLLAAERLGKAIHVEG
ncbi:radical SAM protein [Catenulispora sp. NL8]|uniref:Radical SAM protein n=1 Tax=Catenulispora pinistramenti TaxID=2705254 RepID=A0ABS5KL41_9ACTN|nr:B12-binding domain-containing radical SAM protein [Catenulispora pinistramenti]MBS2546758.1 radical SAM protein [Catenulispora pinistramenti]